MELMTEKKKDFKQTDVGLIPEEWEFKSLESFCDIRDGTHASPKYHQEGVKFVTSKNIIDGRIDFSDISYISKNDAIEIDKRSKVEKNNILMSMIGTIGNSALVDFEPDFSIKNVALIKPIKISPKFLAQYLSSNGFKDYLENKLAGGIQKFVSLGVLRGLKVPVPTSEEQQAIASALSDVDELIRSLDRLIQKKEAIKKGTMEQLLTGMKRLTGFDGEWKVKELGDLFDFLRTGTASRSALSSHGDIGYIHYGDIHSKWDIFLDCDKQKIPKIATAKVKSLPDLKNGDLIIADASEDYEGVGKSIEVKNIGEQSIVAGLHTMLLRAKDDSTVDGFRAYITSIESVKKRLAQIATGTTVYGLSKSKLKEVNVRLPGSKEEQKAIAQILSDMDRELQTLRKKREKYKQVKQGMMQELLTGKTRLV